MSIFQLVLIGLIYGKFFPKLLCDSESCKNAQFQLPTRTRVSLRRMLDAILFVSVGVYRSACSLGTNSHLYKPTMPDLVLRWRGERKERQELLRPDQTLGRRRSSLCPELDLTHWRRELVLRFFVLWVEFSRIVENHGLILTPRTGGSSGQRSAGQSKRLTVDGGEGLGVARNMANSFLASRSF